MNYGIFAIFFIRFKIKQIYPGFVEFFSSLVYQVIFAIYWIFRIHRTYERFASYISNDYSSRVVEYWRLTQNIRGLVSSWYPHGVSMIRFSKQGTKATSRLLVSSGSFFLSKTNNHFYDKSKTINISFIIILIVTIIIIIVCIELCGSK